MAIKITTVLRSYCIAYKAFQRREFTSKEFRYVMNVSAKSLYQYLYALKKQGFLKRTDPLSESCTKYRTRYGTYRLVPIKKYIDIVAMS